MLIYKVTNKTNGKSYIGLTKGTLLERQWHHLGDARNGSTFPFHRALRVHTNVDVWKWEILDECDTEKEASDLEIKYIAEHNTFKAGYNATSGGLREYTSKRTIEEIENLIELDVLTIDHLHKGHPGKPKSKEHISKISESKLAYFQTEEGITARKRRSEKMKLFWDSPEGQKRKEEQRKKCGRPQSEESKQASRIRTKQMWNDGGAERFNR